MDIGGLARALHGIEEGLTITALGQLIRLPQGFVSYCKRYDGLALGPEEWLLVFQDYTPYGGRPVREEPSVLHRPWIPKRVYLVLKYVATHYGGTVPHWVRQCAILEQTRPRIALRHPFNQCLFQLLVETGLNEQAMAFSQWATPSSAITAQSKGTVQIKVTVHPEDLGHFEKLGPKLQGLERIQFLEGKYLKPDQMAACRALRALLPRGPEHVRDAAGQLATMVMS